MSHPFRPAMSAWLLWAAALLALPGCGRQPAAPPPSPQAPPSPPAADVPTRVIPSEDLRGASDMPQAPPAIGALTGRQAAGGATSRPMEPTAGDGSERPASAASR